MNFSFFIFGTPSLNEYDQYPFDSSSNVFQYFVKNRKNKSQLAAYRNGQLIYYVYIQALAGSNNYFGICLVFNSVYCKNTDCFLSLFLEVFFETAKKGKLLQYNKNGEIAFAVQKFYQNEIEIKRLRAVIQEKIDSCSCLIPFDNSLKLENNTFKTTFCDGKITGNNNSYEIENDGHDLLRYLEQKKSKNKKTRRVALWVISALIIILLPYFIWFSASGKNKRIIKEIDGTKYWEVTIDTVGFWYDGKGAVLDTTIFWYIGDEDHNQLPNGEGKAHYTNQDSYDGDFKDGAPHGQGKAHYANGEIYEGNFENGLPHGYGKKTFADKSIYEGNYCNGKAEGEGKMYYTNGSLFFEGTWKDNNPWNGTMYFGNEKDTYRNGRKYKTQ